MYQRFVEEKKVIDRAKFQQMKDFAEHLDDDVAGVTIPKKDMIEIADAALTLYTDLEGATDALLLEQKLTVGLINNCRELGEKIGELMREIEKLKACSICHRPFIGKQIHVNCGDIQHSDGLAALREEEK